MNCIPSTNVPCNYGTFCGQKFCLKEFSISKTKDA